ncbi:MAG: hypothetical protein LBP59_15280 [Planctomycetaceae bacterium]|nr:hypothetical protein [Planctomycetaceae bacterium]
MQAGRPRSVDLACISGSQAFHDRGHLVWVSSGLQAKRLHPRIAGISPACGCTQPLMREVDIWSSLKIHFCPVRDNMLVEKQVKNIFVPLGTTCQYNLNRHCVLNGTLKICIIFFYQHVVPNGTNIYCYKKYRFANIPSALQDRRHFACVSSGSQAERLHHRIAGVSPASGCTQPLTSEV